MRERHLRSVLAVLLSFAMIIGSTVVAFADPETPPASASDEVVSTNSSPAEGSTTGVGKNEGVVSTNIFKVSIPVTSTSNDNLSFVLDPQNLIDETKGKARGWNSASYNATDTLFFLSQNKTYTADKMYGKTSNALSVNNLSSVSVDVALTVKLDDVEGIAISSNNTFEGTDPAMYMALKTKIGDKTDTTALKNTTPIITPLTDEDTISNNKLENIPKDTDKYMFDWDEENGYSFTLSSNYAMGTQADSTLFFWFEGASYAIKDGASEQKWSQVKDVNPTLDVVWNVKPHTDGYDLDAATRATGNWGNGKLWIGKNANTGFESSTPTVKATRDGKTFYDVQHEINDGWVGMTWTAITDVLGADVTNEEYHIIVVDNGTVYQYAPV